MYTSAELCERCADEDSACEVRDLANNRTELLCYACAAKSFATHLDILPILARKLQAGQTVQQLGELRRFRDRLDVIVKDAILRSIRNARSKGIPTRLIAKELGVTPARISQLASNYDETRRAQRQLRAMTGTLSSATSSTYAGSVRRPPY